VSDLLVGQGLAFPLQIREHRMAVATGDERIRQSLWLILATRPGERPMRPEFGCGLRELVFAANTATLRGQVAQRVREAVIRFEPRVDLLDVTVGTVGDHRNFLRIRVDYRVRATNAFFNLVYPFYLEEGEGAPAERLLEDRSGGD
jgi:phage baseplate assembly protein W